jgi:hypothetical protein
MLAPERMIPGPTTERQRRSGAGAARPARCDAAARGALAAGAAER